MCKPIQVVLSLAGRDAGHLLAVVRQDEKGVWLADGKCRPLADPKCKNPRHVQWLEIELEPKAMTTDRALRRALREAEQASRTV
ncbi:MAG: KOW domain-containing RNA-binding protein [Clostridia bacterium]|nr:KOW domain-containing RNA-binding protein [Clostridia bacterium]